MKELNKIFYDAAFYPARFYGLFSVINIILLFVPIFLPIAVPFWIGQAVLATIWFRRERKKSIALERAFKEWNCSTGVDYGVHIEMGGRDGAGP